ncbi:MAG: hypothetical protein LLG00_00560 [Planctomycetaceae bacterium]|nr:hypothetical protein [Planctomycetaceae bacterium]
MLNEYYREPAVRDRMIEFLGGTNIENVSAMYVTGQGVNSDLRNTPRGADELWRCLEDESEVFRSLWDRDSLIAHLDIEYVNFDYPAEPYLDPERSLRLQSPVIETIVRELRRHGISPLQLLTGRGHSLVWRVRRDSPAFHELKEAVPLPESLRANCVVPRPPENRPIGGELGAGFLALGLVLEYLAHRVIKDAQPDCPIPIEVTAIETARAERGREVVSIDLSEYGDPLHTRSIRIPFSAYHKLQQQKQTLGESVVAGLPPLLVVPLDRMGYQEAWRVMRDWEKTAALARVTHVYIPDRSRGTQRLLGAYNESPLAFFHRWFYSQQHDAPQRWPATYDRTAYEPLPQCARDMLSRPNDRLLRPAGIRYIVRVLMALGWHPRHIAGLLRSKYERNYGWGNLFFEYDASARADFYTRLFSGLIATGLDTLDDFTSEALQSQGLCDAALGSQCLAPYRDSLLSRIKYGRLGCRPFHGLFFPDQHL